jgi:hypothetical protein
MIVDWRALTLGVKGRNWVEALCKDAADEAGMRTNRLRATLKAGEIALGTIVWDTRGRGVMHTLAAAGMDFAWICTEHSAFNLETVVDLVAHAHAAGITPIVRIPDLQYEHVTRLLDSGCQSLILPHIRSGAEVRRFIELAKYYPQGRRGMAIYAGASTDYEEIDLPAAMTHANANTLLAVMIETREARSRTPAYFFPAASEPARRSSRACSSSGAPAYRFCSSCKTRGQRAARPACIEVGSSNRTSCRD